MRFIFFVHIIIYAIQKRGLLQRKIKKGILWAYQKDLKKLGNQADVNQKKNQKNVAHDL